MFKMAIVPWEDLQTPLSNFKCIAPHKCKCKYFETIFFHFCRVCHSLDNLWHNDLNKGSYLEHTTTPSIPDWLTFISLIPLALSTLSSTSIGPSHPGSTCHWATDQPCTPSSHLWAETWPLTLPFRHVTWSVSGLVSILRFCLGFLFILFH